MDGNVRLYHVDENEGGVATLLYGSLAEALALAAEQPESVQAGLFIQTHTDVLSYLDHVEQ